MSMDQMNQPPVVGQVKFKYRVIYCSGEDPEYPVTELLDPSSNSRGWQSQKFCQFPQEIILQFPNVVHLKSLQFLSHQSKISSKIELFTFNPQNQPQSNSQIPLNEIAFKKLGYLTLDPNERSGFQARELKSVHVNTQAALLKLLFHKNHTNSFNAFNQVGLVALNCIGPNFTAPQVAQPAPVASPAAAQYTPTAMHMTGMSAAMGNPGQAMGHPGQAMNTQQAFNKPANEDFGFFDVDTQNKLRSLDQDKNLAIQNENYELAKFLKGQIDKLKAVGIQLQNLEGQKQMSIQNENFDEAKRLKQQMEQLKYTAMMNANSNPPAQSPQKGPSMQPQNPGMPRSQMQGKTQADEQTFQKQSNHFGIGEDVRVTPMQDGQPILTQNQWDAQGPAPILDNVGAGLTDKQRAQYNQQYYGKDKTSADDMHSGGPKGLTNAKSPPSQDINVMKGVIGQPTPNVMNGVIDQFSQNPSSQQQVPQMQAQSDRSPAFQSQNTGNIDDEVLPTHKQGGSGNNQPPEYAPGQEISEEELKSGEPIAPEKMAIAQPMIEVFGDQNIRKIFSRTWTLREQGITAIEDDLLNGNFRDEGEAFIQAVEVIKNTIGDKIAGVCQKASLFLSNLCRQSHPQLSDKQRREIQQSSDYILTVLIEKLGDNLLKVRQSAEDAILAMCTHSAFGVKLCLNHLMRGAPPSNAPNTAKKTMNSNKQIIGKYTTLARILSEVSDALTDDQLQNALKFTVKGLTHALQDVRQPATRCMVELYKIMGPRVRDSFGDLRQAQIDQLESALAEVDGYSKGGNKQNKPNETISTNINPKGAQGGGSQNKDQSKSLRPQHPYEDEGDGFDNHQKYQNAGGARSYQHDEQNQLEFGEDEQVCNFCGRFDENFNQESIDIHYWKECPMLTTCWECEQVIEIQTVNDHLVEECQNSEKYKMCGKCKTVILREDFNGHQCIRPKPSGAARCPLCTTPVFPATAAGWKKHQLTDRCPGNNRLAR